MYELINCKITQNVLVSVCVYTYRVYQKYGATQIYKEIHFESKKAKIHAKYFLKSISDTRIDDFLAPFGSYAGSNFEISNGSIYFLLQI